MTQHLRRLIAKTDCRILPGSVLATIWILAASAVVAAGLPQGDPAEAGFSKERLDRIETAIRRAVEKKQISGASAVVANDGKIVYRANVGERDVENKLPTTDDTIYRIASMTKPITSVAAMMLVEEGKLSLDDPLAKFVPEYGKMRVLEDQSVEKDQAGRIGNPSYAKRPITIRHLLTHTSGITYGFFGRELVAEHYRQAEVFDGLVETHGTMADNVKRLSRVPLLFHPGEKWEYGLNTDVLGRVVEIASGQSLDEFFAARIFSPLAMSDTHFALPDNKRSRLAALYTTNKDLTIRRLGSEPVKLGPLVYSATLPLQERYEYFSGGVGLVSTSDDYVRFCQMLLNGGELDGKRLLKPDTVKQMTTNQIGDLQPWIGSHGLQFGYGFGIVGEPTNETTAAKEPATPGTYSWGGIFGTYFFVDPQKKLVGLLMMQIHPNDHISLRQDFQRLVYDALNP
ncbi:MAG TPA: serine hydrolase domain-containing protein [Pirellulales bacterium]|nr:serine hydrolase domain-containing protein [Pirellulales bacterium]